MLYVCIVVAIGDERGCASCCATSCCCCRCSFVFVDAVGPVFGIVEADDVPYVYVIFPPFPLPSGVAVIVVCLLYTSPSPRDLSTSRMPSSA